METEEEVLARVRRRLNAAKARSKLTLEQFFDACDKNKSGSLDYGELQKAVRSTLNVPAHCVCDYELKLLFQRIDADGRGGIDLAELIEYLAHGIKRPEDEAKRYALRMQRVRKNLQMGFQKLSAKERGEMAIRKLFNKIDMDGEGKLSLFEFNFFVRNTLKLSRWDVMNEDLEQFYKFMDKNNDGVDVMELLTFIRNNDKDRMHDFSFYEDRKTVKAEKKLTYRQQLLELRPSSSPSSIRPSDPAGEPLAVLRPSSSFMNLGRSREPACRPVTPSLCSPPWTSVGRPQKCLATDLMGTRSLVNLGRSHLSTRSVRQGRASSSRSLSFRS